MGEAVFFWDFGADYFVVVLGLDATSPTGPGRLQNVVREGRFLAPDEHDVTGAEVVVQLVTVRFKQMLLDV